MTAHYQTLREGGAPVKAWVNGVPFEAQARQQVLNAARLPIIYKWIAVMPDVHLGKGATIGSVIPTLKAIIPAAVGVDLGCGLIATRLSLRAEQLPDNFKAVRRAIERAVPVGRTHHGGRHDSGAWQQIPNNVASAWRQLEARFRAITHKHPEIGRANHVKHLGTLGTGNHFIELCLDQHQDVWVMLHSGSRGVGNKIGTYFINLARQDMGRQLHHLPDRDLAYLEEGAQHFDDYVEAVQWAQEFALMNRQLMAANILDALRATLPLAIDATEQAINCHHNYVQREFHYGQQIWLTRKGAISARRGQLGIIPGSMGASSYIVRGLGNPESFCSCSHGAGRLMSRTQAKKRFTVEDQIRATAGVECRKDEAVLDEHPQAYKPIEQVLAAQRDLVEVAYTLRQLVCVKG